jgi:hypothetical protein
VTISARVEEGGEAVRDNACLLELLEVGHHMCGRVFRGASLRAARMTSILGLTVSIYITNVLYSPLHVCTGTITNTILFLFVVLSSYRIRPESPKL